MVSAPFFFSHPSCDAARSVDTTHTSLFLSRLIAKKHDLLIMIIKLLCSQNSPHVINFQFYCSVYKRIFDHNVNVDLTLLPRQLSFLLVD